MYTKSIFKFNRNIKKATSVVELLVKNRFIVQGQCDFKLLPLKQ
jgi:hypothetical protein